MAENIEKLLEVADKRNKMIPKLLKTGGFHVKRNEDLTDYFQGVFSCFVESFDFYGGENFQEVRRFIANGVPVQLNYKHGSEGDTYAIRYICNRVDFPDIPNLSVYQAGLKMEERLRTRPFFHAEESLLLVTPQDLRELNAIINNEQFMEQLSPADQTLLKTYKSNADRLNLASLMKGRRLQRDEGRITALYPEAGRSRSGNLRLSPEEFSAYYRQKEVMIVPVIIDGAQTTFPVEKWLKPFTKSKLLMIVGKPYSTLEIHQSLIGRENEFCAADYAIFKMSELLPDDRIETDVLEKRDRFFQVAK